MTCTSFKCFMLYDTTTRNYRPKLNYPASKSISYRPELEKHRLNINSQRLSCCPFTSHKKGLKMSYIFRRFITAQYLRKFASPGRFYGRDVGTIGRKTYEAWRAYVAVEYYYFVFGTPRPVILLGISWFSSSRSMQMPRQWTYDIRTRLLSDLHQFSAHPRVLQRSRADVTYSCLVSYRFTLFLRVSQCEVTSCLV
jgi:hypothetical protein